MSKAATEFVKKLQAFTKGENTADVFAATVETVNEDGSVDVKDLGDYEYTCRTQAIDGLSDGVKLKPVVGSVVLVEKIGTDTDQQFAIIMYSSLDEVSMKLAGYTYMVNSAGHQIASPQNDTIKEVFNLILKLFQQIVIFYGTPPDPATIEQTQEKINAIFQ